MPVRWCQFVLCWVFIRVSGIERVSKPVVFSYSSADLPHPATISHHYIAPVQTNSTELGDHKEDSSNHGLVYHQGYVHPYQGYSQIPTNQVFHGGAQGNYNGPAPASVAPPVIYNQPNFEPIPTTYHPENRYLAPANYYGNPPVVNSNYNRQHYPASHAEPDHNQHGPSDGYSSVPPAPPDVAYYSTTPYFEHATSGGYDHPTIPPGNEYQGQELPSTLPYYDDRDNDFPSSVAPPPAYDEQYNYDYSGQNYTDSHPEYGNGYDSGNDLLSTTSNPLAYDYSAEHPFNATSSHVFTSGGSLPISNHTDFQGSEVPKSVQDRPSYGERTNRRFRSKSKLRSSTSSYNLEDTDLINTTPIIEFESIKEKLPSIDDYPPPNPGYITRPFKPFSKMKKNTNKFSKLTGNGQALRKTGFRSYRNNNKVLQTPKFFAYSSDLVDAPVEGGLSQNDDEGTVPLHNGDHSGDVEGADASSEDDGHGKKKHEKYAKGGGQEHHSEHKASGGGKGDKGYKSEHKHTQEEKGHHDKEAHKGKYLDEKGKKAEHKEEGGHYGEHHKADKGKKSAKYGESGEHKKGHSTKGEHNIHKMDEYLKKHEFYDEHHEGGDHEKHGGFVEAHAFKKGGKKKKGHHKSGGSHHHKGKKGHHEKGEKSGLHKGHKDAKGYDAHFAHHKKHGKKGGSKKGMKWGYSKGHPK